MAIREFSSGKSRLRIATFGMAPDDEARRVFGERRYLIEQYSEAQLGDPQFLMGTDSVVFFQRSEKPIQIVHELETYAKTLLNHDCRVYVRVAKSETLQDRARAIVVNSIRELGLPGAALSPPERAKIRHENREREGLILAPYVYVCDTGMSWIDIAQVIAENPAGESPNSDLKMDVVEPGGDVVALEDHQRLLIQRSFHDCSAVHLRRIPGGLSGGMTFQGHYRLSGGLLGGPKDSWPLSCFVKIGTRKQIESEYQNQLGAAVYLPFHLAPRLDLSRCGLGADHGILVGDFIDEAESLSSCASNGRGISVIGNLFNKTLRAWNNTSTVDTVFSLSDWLASLLPPEPPKHRQQLIAGMGATQSHESLCQLIRSFKSTHVRVGRIHGDLHATNVLVRGSDALLIDFEKTSDNKPLVYDAAALEAGLLVDGFSSDIRTLAEIRTSIDTLYDLSVIINWISPCEPHERSAWFFDCVKQIRMYARHLECEPGQYAVALALALFKKSCNIQPFDEHREALRALAYVIAERILLSLSQRT